MTDEFAKIVGELTFDEEEACEVADHDTNKYIHDDGPGVWYSTSRCENCGKVIQLLICNKAKEFMHKLVGLPGGCSQCGFETESIGDQITYLRKNG